MYIKIDRKYAERNSIYRLDAKINIKKQKRGFHVLSFVFKHLKHLTPCPNGTQPYLCNIQCRWFIGISGIIS